MPFAVRDPSRYKTSQLGRRQSNQFIIFLLYNRQYKRKSQKVSSFNSNELVTEPEVFKRRYACSQNDRCRPSSATNTVSEIQRLVGRKLRIFPALLLFNYLAQGDHFRISG